MRRSNLICVMAGAVAVSLAGLSYAVGDAGATIVLGVCALAVWPTSWQLKFMAASRRSAEVRRWQQAVAHSQDSWFQVLASLQGACARACNGDAPAPCLLAQASDRLLCFKVAIATSEALAREVDMTRDEWRKVRRILDEHGADSGASHAALQALGAYCEALLQAHHAIGAPASPLAQSGGADQGQKRGPLRRTSERPDRQPA